MFNFIERLKTHPGIIFTVIAILLPFALFVNLGLMPLISDEPTRAIVTLEMIISGNYINPTINGEFYYNKPPLFNWILAAYTHISGSMSEFILRLPTVISLLLMGVVMFMLSRKSLGRTNAFIVSLMWITSARVLFWDSFQGLIDITYSLVTLTSFAIIFLYSQKRNWLVMFLLSYALAAAGYLMKGIPSIAFQGISLLVWLTYEKNFKKLFSWQHLAGIIVFAFITGAYYFAYLQTNSLNDVFATLFDQSNRISDKEGSLISWGKHLIMFPLEMSYEFAPWTILLLLLIDKRVRQIIIQDKLIVFSLLIFSSNILIYWISADMRPRYLFMLFPLLFIILIKTYSVSVNSKTLLTKIVDAFIIVLSFAGSFSLLIYLFWAETKQIQGVWLIVSTLFLVSITASLLAFKLPGHRLLILIIVMLSVRIAFNTFNLPARYKSYPDAGYRQGEIMAGQLSKSNKIYILGDSPFNHDASFYISRESGQIITRKWEISDKEAHYITDEKNLANFADKLNNYEVLHEFTIKLHETRLFLIKKQL
jgi:4-amino-4-deoxy-L-arabinose transferase-like glycosyltransferase